MEECSLILCEENMKVSSSKGREGEGREVGVWEGRVELESTLGGMAGEGDGDPAKTLPTCPPGCGADEFRGHCSTSAPTQTGG